MTATAAPPAAIDALVDAYLRMLANERGASPHTLRAYERELHGFAAWLSDHGGEPDVAQIEHADSRLPGNTV